jgi:hypothetical protein
MVVIFVSYSSSGLISGPSGFVRGFLIAFKHSKSFEQPTSPRLRRPGKHAKPAKAPCGVLAACGGAGI